MPSFWIRDLSTPSAPPTEVTAEGSADAARRFALRRLTFTPEIVGAEQCANISIGITGPPARIERWDIRAVCEVDDRGVWCIQVGAQRGE